MLDNTTSKEISLEIEKQLKYINTKLIKLGFELKEEQPHISGERVFMSPDKLVLLATRSSDGQEVVIKCSNKSNAKKETTQEKKIRDMLSELDYSQTNISIPKEILFKEIDGYLFFITEFIPQEKVFVSHPLKDQFFMILSSLEGQEKFHLSTYKHTKKIKEEIEIFTEKRYTSDLLKFIRNIDKNYRNKNLRKILFEARNFWNKNKEIVDMYCNNLIHNDFVPHNFRVSGKKIYILDYVEMWFGNKYETWARFLNYVTIHNPSLEKKLTEYIKSYKEKEAYENLRLMRIFKIIYIIDYYTKKVLPKAKGDDLKLAEIRIHFWKDVLKAMIENKHISSEIHQEYVRQRDFLRSDEEKKRQREFSIA